MESAPLPQPFESPLQGTAHGEKNPSTATPFSIQPPAQSVPQSLQPAPQTQFPSLLSSSNTPVQPLSPDLLLDQKAQATTKPSTGLFDNQGLRKPSVSNATQVPSPASAAPVACQQRTSSGAPQSPLLSQQGGSTTPRSAQIAPPQPQGPIRPSAELIQHVSRLCFTQEDGLLQQYLEFTLPSLLQRVVKRHHSEVRENTIGKSHLSPRMRQC